MWRKIRKRLKKLLNILILILVALLVVDLYFELIGVSGRHLWSRLGIARTELKSGRIRFGIFRDCYVPDIRVNCSTSYGPLTGECRQIQIKPYWRSLLRGRIRVESFQIKDGNLSLGNGGLIWLRQVECTGFCREDCKSGKATLKGVFNGIAVEIDVVLDNVDLLPVVLKSQGKGNFTQDFHKKLVESFGEWSKSNVMGNGDVRVLLHVYMDCKDYTAMRVQGAVNVDDGILYGITVEKLYARFSCTKNMFRLQKLVWRQHGDDALDVSGTYDIEHQRLNGQWSASLVPDRVLKLLDKQIDSEFLQRCMPRQVKCKGEVIDSEIKVGSAFNLKNINLQGDVTTFDSRLFPYALSNMQGHIRLSKGVLHLEPFHLTMEGRADELKGKGSFDLTSHRINLEAEGDWNWVAAMGVTLPRWMHLGTSHEAKVQLSIKDSLPNLGQLRASLNFTQSELHLWSGTLNDVKGKLRWEANKLYLDEVSACWEDSPHRAIRLKAAVDMTEHLQAMLNKGMDSVDKMKVLWHIEVDGLEQERKDGKPVLSNKAKTEKRWLPGLVASGTMNMSCLREQVDFEGKASLYFDRINQTYLSQWHYDDYEDVALVYCTDSPFEITFSQAPMTLKGVGLCLKGHASVRNGGFGAFQAKTASCRFEITDTYAKVTEISGVTSEDEPISLGMEITYSPFVWVLSDAKFKGNPNRITPFLTNAKAATVYSQIWTKLKWHKNDLPLMRVSRLQYRSDDLDSAWDLELDGTLEASKVVYSKLAPGDISMDVHLKLPGELNLRNIRLKNNSLDAKGRFDMRFEGNTVCQMRIDECKGAPNIGAILSEMDPTWGKLVEQLSFHKDSLMTCRGDFLLEDARNMSFKGTVKSPECVYFGYKFHELDGAWAYENNCVKIDVYKGLFAKGSCLLTGYLDFMRKEGDLLLHVKRMEGTDFFQYLRKDIPKVSNVADKAKVQGKIDLELDAKYRLGWAGHPCYVTGNGKVSMREGDFWQVPMMKGLGKFLTMSTFNMFGSVQLGKITALDAEVAMLGTRVQMTNLVTDGTLVSVMGAGEYDWETQQVYCVFSGEAMRNMGLISWLFKPLSWAFDVEVKGPITKPEWRTRTGLRKLLIGN